MDRLNTGHWLLGGLAAGTLIWLLESTAGTLYLEEMLTSLRNHGSSMEVA